MRLHSRRRVGGVETDGAVKVTSRDAVLQGTGGALKTSINGLPFFASSVGGVRHCARD